MGIWSILLKSHIFISLDSSGISHLVHLYSLWICQTSQLKNFFLKYSSQSHRDAPLRSWLNRDRETIASKFIQGKHFALPNKLQLQRLKSCFLQWLFFHQNINKKASYFLSIRQALKNLYTIKYNDVGQPFKMWLCFYFFTQKTIDAYT